MYISAYIICHSWQVVTIRWTTKRNHYKYEPQCANTSNKTTFQQILH